MIVEKKLINIISELSQLKDDSEVNIHKVFKKYPKETSGLFSKSETLEVYKKLNELNKINLTSSQKTTLLTNLKLKRVRTISGVTPVTVLTKPYPCPGKCIFCPSDVRMPKSYISSEPGSQRAEKNKFNPYQQTFNRLLALKNIGHPTDKVELIILGGTWTFYPKAYQVWFVKRCLDAMNDFNPTKHLKMIEIIQKQPYSEQELKKQNIKDSPYNLIVSKILVKNIAKTEKSTWNKLQKAQQFNETAKTRCVGLSIETRPDEITRKEIVRIRRLGTTKVQIGFQSLDNEVLKLNKRKHNVQAIRDAVKLLRQAGFKIHAHWMPNLYGSTPQKDIQDFKKMFADLDFKPDELKIYPCSLIANTELINYYKNGKWKPYTEKELLYILKECIKITPQYCRITRVIRDIGSQDIVAGNRKSNFRQLVERELNKEGIKPKEIRSREIKDKDIKVKRLQLKTYSYTTSISKEKFIQFITKKNKLAGFLRLSLPSNKGKHFITELKDTAIIREVHVYGSSVELGKKELGKVQHLGLGTKLIKTAKRISKDYNFKKLAVISSVGTREYYKKIGFKQGTLYQFTKI